MGDSETTTREPDHNENVAPDVHGELTQDANLSAVDRSTLTPDGPAKTSWWPRTSRRHERIHSVLARRQPSITVVLEDVHDAHNASAVLRSCDAIGAVEIHLVYIQDKPPMRAFHNGTSASAAKWIDTHFHDSIESCYRTLRESGHWIFTTTLRRQSIDLYQVDLTQPIALVFGNEKRGASSEAVELADGCIHIPMQGMVESLNISVACAVSLYEVMRQRREAGMYDSPQLDAEARTVLESEWLLR